jgi:mono/diheme cytochrome c family protein
MRRAALLLALLAAACGTATIPEHTSNPYSGQTDAVRAGAKLFREHCATCHGAAAEGRLDAPALGTERVHGRSDAALFSFLTNGDLKRGMPSWSRLPDERRWQIVAFLRSLGS